MRNTRKTQFSTADVVHAAQAHDAVVEAALTAVCAAVAVLHPELPLHDVERIATELSQGDRVAYAALCVVSGSVTQERLTELVESTTDWADFIPRRDLALVGSTTLATTAVSPPSARRRAES